jgi:hypothetical protein
MLVRRHADLVAPVDLGSLLASSFFDGRISLLQPATYFFGVLVAGVATRSLACETPTLQIQTHRANRQGDVQLLADQLAESAAVPQCGSDAQFFGLVAAQQLLDACGLLLGQGASRAERPAGTVVGQSVEAAFDIGRPPVTDGFAADAEEVGHFGLREAN